MSLPVCTMYMLTAITGHRSIPAEQTLSQLRVCSKITSDFGGSAAWPDARREEGASPPVGCDRRATKQMARCRPAPEGWGCLAVWRRCSLLTDRWRVCSSLAPSQTAKQPPAKSEFIFEQTLRVGGPTPRHGADSTRKLQLNMKTILPLPFVSLKDRLLLAAALASVCLSLAPQTQVLAQV